MDSLRLILLILGVVLVAGIYLWETRWRRSKSSADFDDLDTSYVDGLGESRSRKDYGYTRVAASQNLEDDEEFTEEEDLAEDDFGDDDFDEDDFDEDEGLEQDFHDVQFSSDEAELDGLEFIVPGAENGRTTTTTAAVSEGSGGLVIALTVMAAQNTTFSGVAISEVMHDLGFTLGKMQIFHKLSETQALKPVPLYSVANVVKPGTFDLAAIETLSTPGIALFMQVSTLRGSNEVFDAMLAAGTTLARRLGGELRDETRSTLTTQSINHLREQIIEFTRQLRVKSAD